MDMKKAISVLLVLAIVFIFTPFSTNAAITALAFTPSGATVGTYIGASSTITTFTVDTTAVTAGGTITLTFSAETVLTSANIAASDFTIKEDAATATAPSAVSVNEANRTIQMTVASGSLVDGVGAFTIAASATAGGNEIRHPTTATSTGTFQVDLSDGSQTASISNVIFIHDAAHHLKVTGTATMVAGTTNELTIKAYDQYDNLCDGANGATAYAGEKSLTFSGPSACVADGTNPTVEEVNIGSATSVSFTAGVSASNAATLITRVAEVTTVDVSDGTIDSTGDAAWDLDLTVNPAAITLTATPVDPGVVELNWTVPAGCPTGYLVRYSTSDITNQTEFNAATDFPQSWSGTASSGIIDVLLEGVTYYFAMEAKGANNTQAALSNRPYTETPVAPRDTLSPVSTITDPAAGSTLNAGIDYLVKGTCYDLKGPLVSGVKKVEISLDGGKIWQEVKILAKIDKGFSWQYLWLAPKEGEYNLKTRAFDWVGNIETPGIGITLKVVVPEKVVGEVPPEEMVPEEVAPPLEKPIAEMTVEEIKAKIVEIQQKIIELLKQLIELIQAQIAELQA